MEQHCCRAFAYATVYNTNIRVGFPVLMLSYMLNDFGIVLYHFFTQAWAEASLGRQSDGGTPGDPSVWKRNFRSALRARGFKMVFDNKNDAANPHKVYRWPPEGSQSEGKPLTVQQKEACQLDRYRWNVCR